MITATIEVEDDRREYDALIKRLEDDAVHVDIGVHPVSGKKLVKIAATHEFGATINNPGGQPFIIVDAQGGGGTRAQRSARVPLSGGKEMVFLKKGKKGMGVTKPHTIEIPARSFIRSTVDANREKYNTEAAKELQKVLDNGGNSLQVALGRMGLLIESNIKNTIVTLKTPPNKEETKRRKGSDNPLIDTGELLNSIRHIVKSLTDQPVT